MPRVWSFTAQWRDRTEYKVTYVADGVIVDEGLKEGDQVIIEGQQKVCEGTKISL